MTPAQQLGVFAEHEQVIAERKACADLGLDVRMMSQTDDCSDEYRQGWCDGIEEFERLIRTRIDPALQVVNTKAGL